MTEVTTMFLTKIHLLLDVLQPHPIAAPSIILPNNYSVTPCTTGLLVRQSYL